MDNSSRSLPILLSHRQDGRTSSFGMHPVWSFRQQLSRQFLPRSLATMPQILTPADNLLAAKTAAITALNVDRVEQRFVVSGGANAIVNIYDLSKWGSEEYLSSNKSSNRHQFLQYPNTARQSHKPIASSNRERARGLQASTLDETTTIEVPSGHASPITKVQWYPVDSGAFLSSSKDGSLLVWDTESLSPVAHCVPFDNDDISTFHLSPIRHTSAVVASLNDPCLKLVDIRSGSSSHTLLGHGSPGVSSVQWAPHSDVILASGGLDGTVRLFDIRKPGARSCFAIFNQDVTYPSIPAAAYQADYSHLPKPSAALQATFDDAFLGGESQQQWPHQQSKSAAFKKKRITVTTQQVAPNNYRPTENGAVKAHDGGVSGLAFADAHLLVTTGQDGQIHLWDLRANGHMVPLRFLAPGRQPAVSLQRSQIPLLLSQDGKFCWIGNGVNVLGYSLDRGGIPQHVLQGHLHTVTAMDVISANMQLLTGGKDGMILTWAKPQPSITAKRKVDQDDW